MPVEEVDAATPTETSEGDENLEWLYGDESEEKQDGEEEVAKLTETVSAPPPAPVTQKTTGHGVDSKAPALQHMTFGAAPVNLNKEFSCHRNYEPVTAKLKGVDLEAPGSVNGVPVLQVNMESFEEKPWRKAGADVSDYFNYGLNEDTWKAYCDEQRRRPLGLNVMNMSSNTSKIQIKQGRKGNAEKDVVNLTPHAAKSDFITSPSIHKSGIKTTRKSRGTTASISQVERQRCSCQDGNHIQVIPEHPSDSEPTPGKFPGPLPPYIPPTPFLPPLSMTTPPLIAPPNEGEQQEVKLTVAVSAPPPAPVTQKTSGHGVDSKETLADDEDSESDDEVQVTIGYITMPAPKNRANAARPVDCNIKSLGGRFPGTDEGKKHNSEEGEAKLVAAVSAPPPAPVTQKTTGHGVDSKETLSDEKYSESDSEDDNLQVTIRNIKSPAEQEMTQPHAATSASAHCNMNSFSRRIHGRVSCNLKCVEFDGSLSVYGIPELEFSMNSLEDDKDIPWRNPGADLSDHFNYGFNEETWKAYNEKQLRLRRHFLKIPANLIARKIIQWTGTTEKDVANLTPHSAKSDFSKSTNIYKSGINTTRVSPPLWTGPANQDVSYYICEHPEGYDGRPVSPYMFPGGGYPSPMPGAVACWATMVDCSTQCDCYPWCVKEREKERERVHERPRERAHEGQREQELEHTPSAIGYNSDEERFEYRDHTEQGYEQHHERSGQKKEERRRERRHRNKEKSPRCSGHPEGYDGRSVPPYAFPVAACRPPMPEKVASIPSMEHYPWAKKEQQQETEREREQPRERAHEGAREQEREHSPLSVGYPSSSIRYHDDQHQKQHSKEGKDQSGVPEARELSSECTPLLCSF